MGILLWKHHWMLLEYMLGIFFCQKSTNFLPFILYCPFAFYSSWLDWRGSNFINSTGVKLQNHSLLSPCTNCSWKQNDSSELWCSLAESSICPSLSTPFFPPHCPPQGAVDPHFYWFKEWAAFLEVHLITEESCSPVFVGNTWKGGGDVSTRGCYCYHCSCQEMWEEDPGNTVWQNLQQGSGAGGRCPESTLALHRGRWRHPLAGLQWWAGSCLSLPHQTELLDVLLHFSSLR